MASSDQSSSEPVTFNPVEQLGEKVRQLREAEEALIAEPTVETAHGFREALERYHIILREYDRACECVFALKDRCS